jgi:hypothetical protein
MSFVLRKHVQKLLLGLGLLLADGLVFGATNATQVASFVLVAAFLLLMATVYYLLFGLLMLARLYGLPIRRKQRLAGSLTGLVGCLVALQSVGELNVHDILVLLPLVIIGYIYSFYGAKVRDTGV